MDKQAGVDKITIGYREYPIYLKQNIFSENGILGIDEGLKAHSIIFGESGVGKTTLLSSIGMIKSNCSCGNNHEKTIIDEGRLLLDGTKKNEIFKLSSKEEILIDLNFFIDGVIDSLIMSVPHDFEEFNKKSVTCEDIYNKKVKGVVNVEDFLSSDSSGDILIFLKSIYSKSVNDVIQKINSDYNIFKDLFKLDEFSDLQTIINNLSLNYRDIIPSSPHKNIGAFDIHNAEQLLLGEKQYSKFLEHLKDFFKQHGFHVEIKNETERPIIVDKTFNDRNKKIPVMRIKLEINNEFKELSGLSDTEYIMLLSVYLKYVSSIDNNLDMYLFDEFDARFDPQYLKELLTNIFDTANTKHINKIFTSHSMVTLDEVIEINKKRRNIKKEEIGIYVLEKTGGQHQIFDYF